MSWNAIVSIILIAGYILYYFVLMISLYIKYQDFLTLKRKENPKYVEDLGGLWVGDGGKWRGGTFYFRSPLPIQDKSSNVKIQNAIKSHNRLIYLFWYSTIGLIPLILVLNLING